jgi:hypothetical protein
MWHTLVTGITVKSPLCCFVVWKLCTRISFSSPLQEKQDGKKKMRTLISKCIEIKITLRSKIGGIIKTVKEYP